MLILAVLTDLAAIAGRQRRDVTYNHSRVSHVTYAHKSEIHYPKLSEILSLWFHVLLARHAKQVAEGAGAASLAAAIKLRDGLRGKKVVGIVTGGNIPLEPIRGPKNGTMEHN